jgi:hypothetical protein
VLPSEDFKYELVVGYAMELFLTTIPMLFIQMFNNSSRGEMKLKTVQSVSPDEIVFPSFSDTRIDFDLLGNEKEL